MQHVVDELEGRRLTAPEDEHDHELNERNDGDDDERHEEVDRLLVARLGRSTAQLGMRRPHARHHRAHPIHYTRLDAVQKQAGGQKRRASIHVSVVNFAVSTQCDAHVVSELAGHRVGERRERRTKLAVLAAVMLVADVVPVEVGDERRRVGLVATRSVQRELDVNTVVRFCGGGGGWFHFHFHLLAGLDGALETDGESIVTVAVDGVKRVRF